LTSAWYEAYSGKREPHKPIRADLEA
jgi:hypothetical protein